MAIPRFIDHDRRVFAELLDESGLLDFMAEVIACVEHGKAPAQVAGLKQKADAILGWCNKYPPRK